MLTVGSLFSGIGGLDLGFERNGFRVIWHVEIDEFCRDTLIKNWPTHITYSDIKTVCGYDVPKVDVLIGGFPCQDISKLKKDGAGIFGSRSGLWKEYKRLIFEIKPRYVVIENVAMLLRRGFGVVLKDLAEIGYDAEWQVLSADAFGAKHQRKRLITIAYPYGIGLEANSNNTVLCQETFDIWNSRFDKSSVGENVFWQKSESGEILSEALLVGGADEPTSKLDKQRIKACGNAVYVAMAEFIAFAIREFDRRLGDAE